jgi:uncharacterized LabA/DUF88 family protein
MSRLDPAVLRRYFFAPLPVVYLPCLNALYCRMTDLLRAAVFIDVGYLNVLLKKAEVRINYEKFADSLVKDFNDSSIVVDGVGPQAWRWRTYVYDGLLREPGPSSSEEYTQKYDNKKKFLLRIADLPRFQVRVGKMKAGNQGEFRQKRVDMMLGVDMTRIAAAKQAEVMLLVAGDSDFVPAVESVRDSGALIYLYHAGHDTLEERNFDELRQYCDQSRELTVNMLRHCAIHK